MGRHSKVPSTPLKLFRGQAARWTCPLKRSKNNHVENYHLEVLPVTYMHSTGCSRGELGSSVSHSALLPFPLLPHEGRVGMSGSDGQQPLPFTLLRPPHYPHNWETRVPVPIIVSGTVDVEHTRECLLTVGSATRQLSF